MTIKECIDIVDNSKPNQYSTREKVMWLSFIDETIINDVLKTHEGYDEKYDDFAGYSEDKLSVPLIVQSPYDRLYPAYLKMKIDGENGETARYNNSAALFNSYYMEYRKYYNKTHLPIDATKSKPIPKANQENAVFEATYENLKRELYARLSEDLDGVTSKDRLYAIINEFVINNVQMLKGKDGLNGKDGRDGVDGKDGKDGKDGNSLSIEDIIDAIKFISIVDALPEVGESNKIYLVPKAESQTQDLFDEYLWINDAWEWITTKQVEVNLDEYLKKNTEADVAERIYGIDTNGNQKIFGVAKTYGSYALPQCDAYGCISCASPRQSYNAATKGYVDENCMVKPTLPARNSVVTMMSNGTLTTTALVHESATAWSTVLRDNDGCIKVGTPVADLDAATKRYVDDAIAALKAELQG